MSMSATLTEVMYANLDGWTCLQEVRGKSIKNDILFQLKFNVASLDGVHERDFLTALASALFPAST